MSPSLHHDLRQRIREQHDLLSRCKEMLRLIAEHPDEARQNAENMLLFIEAKEQGRELRVW